MVEAPNPNLLTLGTPARSAELGQPFSGGTQATARVFDIPGGWPTSHGLVPAVAKEFFEYTGNTRIEIENLLIVQQLLASGQGLRNHFWAVIIKVNGVELDQLDELKTAKTQGAAQCKAVMTHIRQAIADEVASIASRPIPGVGTRVIHA